MAQYTKHPIAAPPSAPERESTGHLMLRGYIILALFATFAHSAVYNLIGQIGAVVVLIVFLLATLALAIPMLARRRPQSFAWRRLPWSAMAYTALALLSLLWSQWPAATALTWLLLATVTINALFIAHVLTWNEIIRALASAFKWILGLSILLEAWVALVVQGPLLPNFFDRPDGDIDAHWYWVRGNLFDGDRLQGIVGNSNLLAVISLLALIVFGVRIAVHARWRTTHILWSLLALFLFVRAGSATAYICAAVAAVVLVAVLVMRPATAPGRRTRLYALFIGGSAVVVAALWLLQKPILALLGRSGDLTGRSDDIWQSVWERAITRPFAGNGFSSPWVPGDPAFAGWIKDHGITVFHAHNMWLDAFLQLGALGVLLLLLAYGSLLWRSWFFAVDRPRWDGDGTRPFSPLTLVPTLFTVVLLVQGLTESTPIMLWGWMLLVLLSFKIKSVPLVGVGERERVTERGRRSKRVP